jgi:hypothetical protein
MAENHPVDIVEPWTVGTDRNGAGYLPVIAGRTEPELVGPDLVKPDLVKPDLPDPLADLDLPDPSALGPRAAAARYRALLAESDRARVKIFERLQARQEGDLALARRHRDAAEDIRSRVEGVWRQVAEPLAQHGLSDLDQLRPAAAGGEPAAAAVGPPVPGGRPVARRGTRSAARSGRGRGRRAGAPGGAGAESGRTGPVVASTVDPATAPAEAYQLCLNAMSQAAELRAVNRAGSSASVGLLTGAGCALVAGVVAVVRIFLSAAGLPCLVAAAVACAALVTVGADGGARAAARAALMGAGTAGVAVLVTLRFVPPEPVGIIGSLAAVALALRFGLGFGAPAGDGKAVASGKAGAPGRGGGGKRR